MSLIPGTLSLLKTTLLSEMKIIVLSFLAHSIICVSFARKKKSSMKGQIVDVFNVKSGGKR